MSHEHALVAAAVAACSLGQAEPCHYPSCSCDLKQLRAAIRTFLETCEPSEAMHKAAERAQQQPKNDDSISYKKRWEVFLIENEERWRAMSKALAEEL